MRCFKKVALSLVMVVCLTPLSGCFLLLDVLFPMGEDKTINEIALSALPTEGGGFIIAGESYSNCSETGDVYLAEFDLDGKELWKQTLGGPENERIMEVAVSADDAFLVAGTTESYGHGASDIYLLKIDRAGDVIWSKAHGGSGQEDIWGITATADGGAVVLASRLSFTTGTIEWIWMKIGADGALLGEKTLDTPNLYGVDALRPCENGDFILLAAQDLDDYYVQPVLMRVDEKGAVLWSHTLPDSAYFTDVTVCSDGGFALVGSFMSITSWEDNLYWYRVDADGGSPQANIYESNSELTGQAITECANGDFVFTGSGWLFGSAAIVRTDAAGVEKWVVRLDSDDGERILSNVQELSDDTLVLTGNSFDWDSGFFAPMPSTDAYLLHMDAEGVQLMDAVSGEEEDDGECVSQDFFFKDDVAEQE
jgi:hypothetical protein